MQNDIKHKLAKKLRSLRGRYGYTQEELADLAGVDYKHIQRLESNSPPAAQIDTLEKIAKAFKTSPSQLLK